MLLLFGREIFLLIYEVVILFDENFVWYIFCLVFKILWKWKGIKYIKRNIDCFLMIMGINLFGFENFNF